MSIYADAGEKLKKYDKQKTNSGSIYADAAEKLKKYREQEDVQPAQMETQRNVVGKKILKPSKMVSDKELHQMIIGTDDYVNPQANKRVGLAKYLSKGAQSVAYATTATVPIIAQAAGGAVDEWAENNYNNPAYLQQADRLKGLKSQYNKMDFNSMYDNSEALYEAPGGYATGKRQIMEQGILAAQETADKLKYKATIDPDHLGQKLIKKSIEKGTEATEDLDDGVLKWVGDNGLSVLQNLIVGVGTSVATGSTAAGGAAMSSMAAARRIYELEQEGQSATESLLRGVTSGAIEYATEKIPLDAVLHLSKAGKRTFMEVVKSFAKQSSIEATEEGISYGLNYLADKGAKDPNASFSLNELGQAMLGGAFSGGIMGTGANIFGNFRDAGQVPPQNTAHQPIESVQTIIARNTNGEPLAQLLQEPEVRKAVLSEANAEELLDEFGHDGAVTVVKAAVKQEQAAKTVLDGDGNIIYRQKDTDNPLKTGLTIENGITSGLPVSSDTDMAQNNSGVNTYDMQENGENTSLEMQQSDGNVNTNAQGRQTAQVQEAHIPTQWISAAKEEQVRLNDMLSTIANELGISYESSEAKSIGSIANKLDRKKNSVETYSLFDIKDLARSKLELKEFAQIPQVIEILTEKNIPYQIEAKSQNEWGYQGFHIIYRNPNGIGVEIQITRPDVWDVKKKSDGIYEKWRNVDVTRLTPEQFKQRAEDMETSNKMWGQLDLPDFTTFATSTSDNKVPSAVSQPYSGAKAATQEPLTNSFMGNADVSTNRPDSVSIKAIKTPPLDNSIIPNQDGNVNTNEEKEHTEQEPVKTSFKVGELVSPIDRNNKGKVIAYNAKTERYNVYFRSPDGAEAVVAFPVENLKQWKSNLEPEEKKQLAKQKKESKPYLSEAAFRNRLLRDFKIPVGIKGQVSKEINNAAEELYATGIMGQQTKEELFKNLYENGIIVDKGQPEMQALHKDIGNITKYVSLETESEFGGEDKSFIHSSGLPIGRLTNNKKNISIDTAYDELQSIYGMGLFPELSHQGEMLELIARRYESTAPVHYSLAEQDKMDREQFSADRNDELFEMQLQYYEDIIDQAVSDFSAAAKIETKRKDIDQKQNKKALQKTKEYYKERNKKALQKTKEYYKERNKLDVSKMKEWYKKRDAERREQNKINRQYGKDKQYLLRMMKNLEKYRKISDPETQVKIIDVIGEVDLNSVSMREDTRLKIQELRNIEEKIQEDNPDWIPDKYTQAKIQRLEQIQVGKYPQEIIYDLIDISKNLLFEIETNKKMIADERNVEISQVGREVLNEISETKERPINIVHETYGIDTLSPKRFFEKISGWEDGQTVSLYQALEDGQTKSLAWEQKISNKFQSFVDTNKSEIETWRGANAERINTGHKRNDVPITITKAQRMSLYLHSLNNDNLRHITHGGINIPNEQLYKQGKRQAAYDRGGRLKLNRTEIQAITNKMSQTEKDFVKLAQEFFNVDSKQAINETSLKTRGYEVANVNNYFPITVEKNYVNKEYGSILKDGTLENQGALQERIQSKSPIVLEDLTDVIFRQIDNVSKYYGYAAPIRDFNAVMNYKHTGYENGVKAELSLKQGQGAIKYINKLIEDIQETSGGKTTFLGKARGNYAQAVLSFNPVVTLSQVASYPTAAATLGWNALNKGVFRKVDRANIDKYTPLLWYRTKGNSSIELGDIAKNRDWEKKMPGLMNWIQDADEIAIKRIWAASEVWVEKNKKDIKAKTPEFYEETAKIFNRAVYDTQPNYTTLQRPNILRTDSDLLQSMTMFQTQRMQNYNIIVEKMGKFNTAIKSEDDGKIKQAKSELLKSTSGIIAGSISIALIRSILGTLLTKGLEPFKDEDGKHTEMSVLKVPLNELAASLASNVLWGSELYTVLNAFATDKMYYGIEPAAFSVINDTVTDALALEESLIRSAEIIKDFHQKGQSTEGIKIAADVSLPKIKKLSFTLSQLAGVPAKNMEKYLLGGVEIAFPEFKKAYVGKLNTPSEFSKEKMNRVDFVKMADAGIKPFDFIDIENEVNTMQKQTYETHTGQPLENAKANVVRDYIYGLNLEDDQTALLFDAFSVSPKYKDVQEGKTEKPPRDTVGEVKATREQINQGYGGVAFETAEKIRAAAYYEINKKQYLAGIQILENTQWDKGKTGAKRGSGLSVLKGKYNWKEANIIYDIANGNKVKKDYGRPSW